MGSLTAIVIAGSTGTGKTAVAARLARSMNGEIISADSRQVYRYLDIGTNKSGTWDPRRKLRIAESVPQHLTDIIDPSEWFSAGDFVRIASERLESIAAEGKVPFIVGGTGLYIKALIDGLAPLPEKDEEIRRELREKAERYGSDHLYRELKKVDPVSAEKNRGNPQRLIRALEVYLLTGEPLPVHHARTKPYKGTFVQFGLRWPREDLYRQLDARCETMLRSGMLEETRSVMDKGFAPDAPGLQSIGYRSIVSMLNGTLSLEEAADQLKRDTRHYAKRQETWFRADPRITWIPVTEKHFNPSEIAGNIAKSIENML
jgi:tRNA dimethylallyltransferase